MTVGNPGKMTAQLGTRDVEGLCTSMHRPHPHHKIEPSDIDQAVLVSCWRSLARACSMQWKVPRLRNLKSAKTLRRFVTSINISTLFVSIAYNQLAQDMFRSKMRQGSILSVRPSNFSSKYIDLIDASIVIYRVF